MIVYLDTSALLKLFVEEPESSQIRETVEEAIPVTHLITYAEMRAALARAQRMGRIAKAGYERLLADLNSEWDHFSLIDTDFPLVRRAGELAERFALRGYDSVQLAAAELSLSAAGTQILFAAFDASLNDGAKTLGMATLSTL
jgi:predicted nucleic acid-binding protein